MVKKGQAKFGGLILFIMVFLIFIFAAPSLTEIILGSTSGVGTATAFIMKISLWVILLVMIAVFINIASGEGGLFT